jgi:hypothetical protein
VAVPDEEAGRVTKDTRRHLRALVDAVLGDREDAAVVKPVLTVQLRTSIADFERFCDRRHAKNRVVDHDILLARNRAAKAAGK